MDNPCRVRPTGDDGDDVVADDADDDDDHDDDDDDNDPDVEDDDDPPPEQQAPSMPAADQVENIRNFFFKRHIANQHHSNSYWRFP